MCRVFINMSVYVWIYIFRAYFCDLVRGVGDWGTADAERAHMLFIRAYL